MSELEQETMGKTVTEPQTSAGPEAAAQPGGAPKAAEPPTAGEKFCMHCGARIPKDAVICVHCGRQVEKIEPAAAAQPSVVINNSNANTNTVTIAPGALKKEKNKWAAFLLCLFLGLIGAHKFYEGKIGLGILYIFTVGLFGIGALVDLIILLFKPNPYYV